MPELAHADTPTVLIVDDDDEGRVTLGWVLQAHGFAVREAPTAAHALRSVREGPDLVVLDVVLPDQNGFEVCRRIKADPVTAATPVLMLSGRAVEPEDRVRGLDGGADAFLTKPAEPAVLVAHARALLRVRRAEEELRRSEARWRAVAERAFDGVALAAADGTVLYASPSSLSILGYVPAELIGRNVLRELVHPDDRPTVWDGFVRQQSSPGSTVTATYRLRHKDGSWRWVEIRRTNLLDDPDVGALVTNLRDVTDQRAAQEAHALLACIVESSEDAIVSIDLGGHILTWNPAAERLFGYPAAEVVGRPVEVLTPPGHRADTRGTVERVRRGERIAPYEAVRVRKDGREVRVAVTASAVRSPDGRVIALAATYRDVTERARMEAALRESEERFRQAQKMEAVGRLAGGVAHDFNNLLTVINGFSELLAESLPAGDPGRDLAGEVRRAGERAAGLTRQLLAFSRQQVLAPRVLDLNAVVTDLGRLLRRLLGEDVELATDLMPGLWPVRADPGQVEQVVVNLAVNARDAMPTGGRLTVGTRNVTLGEADTGGDPELRPGDYVLLSVSDTGVGMTDDVKARAFDPFFTTKEQGKGTGLGLATVHGIVRQTGGHVEVESEPGRGSTFRVYLPRTDGSAEAGTRGAGPGDLPRGTETVLVAEDEPAVRALTCRVLRGCGYAVLEAGGAGEAARAAGAHPGPIHLLVTDVVMPGVGGRQLAELLRADRPGLRVLYLSGYTDDAVVRHGVYHDRVHFLPKPFAPAELARKVREVLDSQPGGGPV